MFFGKGLFPDDRGFTCPSEYFARNVRRCPSQSHLRFPGSLAIRCHISGTHNIILDRNQSSLVSNAARDLNDGSWKGLAPLLSDVSRLEASAKMKEIRGTSSLPSRVSRQLEPPAVFDLIMTVSGWGFTAVRRQLHRVLGPCAPKQRNKQRPIFA